MQLTTGDNISLKTTLINFAASWVKRGQKAGFFAPDKLENHTAEAEKERARRKKEVEEEKKKKKTREKKKRKKKKKKKKKNQQLHS